MTSKKKENKYIKRFNRKLLKVTFGGLCNYVKRKKNTT